MLGQFACGMQHNPAARQWMLLPAEFWQRWNARQKMWVFLQQHDVEFFKQTSQITFQQVATKIVVLSNS